MDQIKESVNAWDQTKTGNAKLNREEGLYYSATISKNPEDVFAFAKDEGIYKKILSDLPEELENFLNLKISDSQSASLNQYEIKLSNAPKSKIDGDLFLTLSPGPGGKGTVVFANAKFAKYTLQDQGPSDLINVFLKRFKALAETGVLATTKGQPNGKDEVERTNTKH